MANKREFKKYVDALGSSVCEEMMTSYYNVEGADKKKIAAAIEKVLAAIGKAKDNANVYFDRGVRAFEDHKAYSKAKQTFFKNLFNKITTEFGEDINLALKDFNAALPASAKAANKEAAEA